jgi:hypothetical protein
MRGRGKNCYGNSFHSRISERTSSVPELTGSEYHPLRLFYSTHDLTFTCCWPPVRGKQENSDCLNHWIHLVSGAASGTFPLQERSQIDVANPALLPLAYSSPAKCTRNPVFWGKKELSRMVPALSLLPLEQDILQCFSPGNQVDPPR